MTQEERISKELAEIQSRIPKNLRDNIVTERPRYPNYAKLVELALADPNFPEEKKKNLELIKKNTPITSMQLYENPKIAKKIDEFVKREINKKIKSGLLPKRSQIKNLEHVKDIYKKVHSEQDKVQD